MDDHKCREIRISVHNEFDCGGDWLKCIGYLSQWAINSPKYYCLRICIARDGEISASYRETWDGPQTYFICGIRDTDGSYSTHS